MSSQLTLTTASDRLLINFAFPTDFTVNVVVNPHEFVWLRRSIYKKRKWSCQNCLETWILSAVNLSLICLKTSAFVSAGKMNAPQSCIGFVGQNWKATRMSMFFNVVDCDSIFGRGSRNMFPLQFDHPLNPRLTVTSHVTKVLHAPFLVSR